MVFVRVFPGFGPCRGVERRRMGRDEQSGSFRFGGSDRHTGDDNRLGYV